MQVQEQVITLRKLSAGEGKVIISKSKDEEGNPVIVAKQLYLAIGDTTDNYEEVDEGSVVINIPEDTENDYEEGVENDIPN